MRLPLPLAAFLCLIAAAPATAQIDPSADHLPGTEPLVMDEPLDVVMVRGINYFAEREIADSPNRRRAKWNRDYSSPEAYAKSVEPNRQRLREIIGAVDPLIEAPRSLFSSYPTGDLRNAINDLEGVLVTRLGWEVMEGVTGEGYIVANWGPLKGLVVLIPDPEWTPEAVCGLDNTLPPERQIARRLAESGCAVIVVAPLNRETTYSGHPDIRYTNMPHREFVYRMAFEMGRHIIGYEVQKVRAAVSALNDYHVYHSREVVGKEAVRENGSPDVPLAVCGIGEGGLIALYAAAIDTRFQACYVSGYFNERQNVWQEPIYRNVWSLLAEFGDADIASLIAPRHLIVDAGAAPEVAGPPAPGQGRASVAAPGRILTPPVDAVSREFAEGRKHYQRLGIADHVAGWEPNRALSTFLAPFGITALAPPGDPIAHPLSAGDFDQLRQKRQVAELVRFTQRLMHRSDKARDKLWASVDRSSVDNCVASLEAYRNMVYDQMIGRLPEPTIPLNPRTRKVIDEETHVGYEVVLDCYPAGDTERPIPDGADVKIPDTGSVDKIGWAVGKDWGVIAGGILLLPKDLKEGERRPVVVCQHGLEGTPMDTIVTDPNSRGYGPYKGFSTALVQRGFIVYAPQNPYRGHDAFRVIQRKSNPMGRSLFSYIIPQHARTLEWLASLPYVDRDRIAFYGLSYGGKTAVRVPPMLPPSNGERRAESGEQKTLNSQLSTLNSPGYCLSICSADFNEWVRKNASSEDRYSYVYTGEYEIFEWNMGHVANYAELSYLMTPRPFMVERGHDDGVAPDEWVAWEYAKVKRHYDRLGLGDRTELEVFNGPHTINGVGTYAFLHKHLNWPER